MQTLNPDLSIFAMVVFQADRLHLWTFWVFALLGTTSIVPYIYGSVSRRLEKRADLVAKSNEPDAGAYARALLRGYEDNLLPSVSSRGKATHPDLYDRLLATGVTPEFPRPAPASSESRHGVFFAGLLGILLAFFVDHITHAF